MLGGTIKPMKEISYFRYSLFAPIVFPLVLLLIGLLSQAIVGTNEATGITRWSIFFISSLYIGGIPYMVFAVAVFYWSRRKDLQLIKRFSLVAPLIFSIFFVFVWITFVLISKKSTPDSSEIISSGYLALFCLGFGYLYVALVHLMHALLKKFGRIIITSKSQPITQNPKQK